MWQARLLGLLWVLLAATTPSAAGGREVHLVQVDGLTSPANAMYVQRSLKDAREEDAEALVIEIIERSRVDRAQRTIP